MKRRMRLRARGLGTGAKATSAFSAMCSALVVSVRTHGDGRIREDVLQRELRPARTLEFRGPVGQLHVGERKGDPSCRARWCTRKYAASAPSSSAATASSIDCVSASAPVRT